MSVHNDETRLLDRSIPSIIAQKEVDLEFIIVDDGSRESVRDALEDHARRDPRIRLVHQENTGLTGALIRGCALARGEFIARQDADDVSRPRRLQAGLSLIQSNPRICMVSSWVRYIGPEEEILDELTRPSDPVEATDKLLHARMGPPAHGSVMFRRSVYNEVGGYRPEFYFAQDSDLWLRLGDKGWMAYCQEYLYDCLVSPVSISSAHHDLQMEIGSLVHECQKAREAGLPESEFLMRAAELAAKARTRTHTPGPQAGYRLRVAKGNYRIGAALARRRDARAAGYLMKAVRANPFHMKAWIRLLTGL